MSEAALHGRVDEIRAQSDALEPGDQVGLERCEKALQRLGQAHLIPSIVVDVAVRWQDMSLAERGLSLSGLEFDAAADGQVRACVAYNAFNAAVTCCRLTVRLQRSDEYARFANSRERWIGLAHRHAPEARREERVAFRTNLACDYITRGRFPEAIDQAHDALAEDPEHPIALAALGRAALRWTELRLMATRPPRALVVEALLSAERTLRVACGQPDRTREAGYDGTHAHHKAWHDRALLVIEAVVGQSVEATEREHEPYAEHLRAARIPTTVQRWREAGLDLRSLPISGGCAEHAGDVLQLRQATRVAGESAAAVSTDGDASGRSIITASLNAAREDYVVARRLYLEATDERRTIATAFTRFDPAPGSAHDEELGMLKAALRLAFDAVDKLGVALNQHWEFGLATRDVSFHKVIGKRRAPSQRGPGNTLPSAQNPWFDALDELERSLVGFRNPGGETTVDTTTATAPTIREHRNAATHRYVSIRADGATTLAPSLTRNELRILTLDALRVARSAIQYTCFGLDHDLQLRLSSGA